MKKRPPIRRVEEACTLEEWDARSLAQESEARNKLSVQKVAQLAMTGEDMVSYDYVIEIPDGFGGSIPTEEGGSRTCDRCATQYIVHGNLNEVRQSCLAERASLNSQQIEARSCQHHWGRLGTTKTGKKRVKCHSALIDFELQGSVLAFGPAAKLLSVPQAVLQDPTSSWRRLLKIYIHAPLSRKHQLWRVLTGLSLWT